MIKPTTSGLQGKWLDHFDNEAHLKSTQSTHVYAEICNIISGSTHFSQFMSITVDNVQQ